MAESEKEACPKCGRVRGAGEDACARCGLLVVRWGVFSSENRERPEVAPLWEACEAAWGEARAHDRLIAAAIDLGLLPEVARRYRARRDADPADAVAEARLKQIAVLVETAARAQAERPLSPRTVRLLWGVGYLVALVVLLVTLWFVVRTFGAGRNPRPG